MSRLACLTALALCVACDQQGVSVGTEELCQLDPLLVSAQASSNSDAPPPCARIGGNRLVDGSFETPAVGDCNNGFFCAFPASQVPGWDTSGELQVIEVWSDQHADVPPYEGLQFAELDASSPDTLFQDLALSPGQLMYWSLAHRGRNGLEDAELSIGSPDAPVSQRMLESSNDAWSSYSGLYVVGDDEPVTRFAIASRSGTTEGNFIDAVTFAPVE